MELFVPYAQILKKNCGVRCVLFMVVAAVQVHTGRAQAVSSFDLNHTLSPEHPCRSFERPIQFFSETALLVLSGPAGDCYRSVTQLALNLISTDGKPLVRKRWQSTDPGLVFAPGRLLVATAEGLAVDDRTLAPIQSLRLPQNRSTPILLVRQQATASVFIYDQPLKDPKELLYGGEPLKLLKAREASRLTLGQRVFEFADGQTILRNNGSLFWSDEHHNSRMLMSLNWVIPPCEGYVNCQAYDAGAHFQVSTGKFSRILVFSNGSKFPVTDAAGLFPYFRLEVFDIQTAQTLYREENFLRTGERYASISPDGIGLRPRTAGRLLFGLSHE